MCGIMGYIGNRNAKDILIDGLKRLEYRGYDSAGIATLESTGIRITKAVGPLCKLVEKTANISFDGTVGIGHTRWATHGKVTEQNAHPHISSDHRILLVHNGVIENFQSIKNFLLQKGYSFSSETDSEVLANLIAYHYEKESTSDGKKNRFLESVRKALLHVRGTYGIAVLCTDCPREMIGARNSSPLVLGIGKDEFFLSSDVAGFAARTRDVVYLNDNELVHIHDGEFQMITLAREEVEAVCQTIDWDSEASNLNGYPHYMLKEIFEQPQVLENAMRGRFSTDGTTAHFGGLKMTPAELRQIDRIILCGCGTAWIACLVAEHFIEKYARIPVEVEYASEFRYKNAPIDRNTLVMVISQSGETIDTLAAMKEAQRKGLRVLAITNTVGSTIARESDGGIYQHAGPEIGVASTKAFTSQLCIVAMLALYLGRLRDMSPEDGSKIVNALKELPILVQEILKSSEKIKSIAQQYKDYGDVLFLGRQSMYPIALEGALKLKEISYIHAEGFPAAEMKHGPIALVSKECPAVVLTCDSACYEKTISNLHEVRARGARVIAVATHESGFSEDDANDTLWIPSAHPILMPILATIPLQLLAYYVADARGQNVDKPRNLAKSVTVE